MTLRVDAVESNLTESFVYDNLNRLVQASGSGMSTRSLSYDALGNITYKSDAGTYTYPVPGNYRPHAVSSIAGTVNGSFAYDANGSLTSGLNRTLTYTSFNMPASVTAANNMLPGTNVTYEYTYNAEHERVRHIINRADGIFTTFYLNSAGQGQLLYEKEVTPTGTEHKHYISAGGLLVGVYLSRSDSTTETRYFHHDRLGSLTLITNASGGQIERLAYEAFGKRRFPAGAADPNNTLFGITTDRGFTSHEHLDEMGLIHMNGRVYDPLVGRFMTADPFVQSPGNLQSYNRYSYGFNNPLSGIDPTGYSWWTDFRDDILKPVVIAVVSFYTGGAAAAAYEGFAASAILEGGTAFTIAGGISGTSAIVAGAAGGFTGSFLASGGDIQAGLQGAAMGGIGGGFGAAFAGSGVFGQMTGSGINGYLQTGTVQGFVRGFAAGAIPQDLGIDDYWKNGAANIGIGIARDGIRGAIVEGNGKGFGAGVAYGQVTNAFGHLYGYAMSEQAPKFRDGAFYYRDTGPFIDRYYQAITFGNTIAGPSELFVDNGGDLTAKFRSLDLHERGHVQQATWLGAAYLPAQAVSQWIGNGVIGGRGAFLEYGPLHPFGYEMLER